MTKNQVKTLLFWGILLTAENIALKVLLPFMPELVRYVFKTLVLALTFYLIAHKPQQLTMPLRTRVPFLEQLRVNSFNLIYFFFAIIPMIALGIYNGNYHVLPKAIIISICAGFLEEYLCRGVFLFYPLKDGIKSHKQVLQVVLLTSLIFGLAHMGNLFNQPLSATLYQVYYAAALGLYYAAVVIRTKTLWWTIIMHVLIDFASIFVSGTSNANSSLGWIGYLIWLPVIWIAFMLLRPKQVEKLIDKDA